ncbi:MAG TPA: hypothetical protein VNA20_09085 [Frankiaceae bacterium]|nr:hypothetical protein [Frankiaceae bacterium]
MGNDRGGMIVGYFTKIAVTFALVAVVGFDAISVGVARFKVEDSAVATAAVAAERWNDTKDPTQALTAAVNYAEDNGVEVDQESFGIATDGTVTLTVTKQATTLLLFRTKRTGGWTQASATGSAKPV